MPMQGTITLPVTLGTYRHKITEDVDRVLCCEDGTSACVPGNYRPPALNQMRAIASTHQMMKEFATPMGVGCASEGPFVVQPKGKTWSAKMLSQPSYFVFFFFPVQTFYFFSFIFWCLGPLLVNLCWLCQIKIRKRTQFCYIVLVFFKLFTIFIS